MFVPYGVDVPLDRRPVMNWLLIASAVIAFVLQVTAPDPEAVEAYVLKDFMGRGLLGHIWMHGDIVHIAGNLLFLFVFGNAVCSKVGNVLFVPLYVLFGLAAAMMHLLFDGRPMIGASGAINGVVGMYLVFFPLNDINCLLMILPYVRSIAVSGFWLIGTWFAFDIFGAAGGVGYVAYFAHIGGFLSGFGIALLLLRWGFVKMNSDELSLLDLWGDYKRRKEEDILIQNARPPETMYASKEFETSSPSVRTVDIAAKPTEPVPSGKMRFLCACGQKIIVPVSYAGKTGKCPGCQQRVRIPDSENDAAL